MVTSVCQKLAFPLCPQYYLKGGISDLNKDALRPVVLSAFHFITSSSLSPVLAPLKIPLLKRLKLCLARLEGILSQG